MEDRRDHQGNPPLKGGATEKKYFLGTHRIRSPRETWDAVTPLFPRIGISRVADVTRLDSLGVPVFQAIRPRSRNLSVSQGKGVTPEAARVSAVMEALELWHVERLDAVAQTVLSLREMRHANPIPGRLLRWLADARSFDTTPIPWIRLRSLTRERSGWLPREMVELDFELPSAFAPRMFMRTSNGLASGNCLEEAELHALAELVERHAVYLSRLEPHRRRPLDPGSVECPSCRHLIDGVRAAGMKLGLYDLTWEVGVATVLVELVGSDLPVVWRGSGTHPAPDIALSRALTEAAQSRLTFISGARDDLPELAPGLDAQGVFDAYAEPASGRPVSELPDLATAGVAGDLGRLIERLAAAGYEPFAVELTRPEIGVPVALAFVPGLLEVPHG